MKYKAKKKIIGIYPYLEYKKKINIKNLIIASTILDIVEIVLLVICFGYYIKQYFFGDYIDELYKKFCLEMGEEDTYGNHITNGFEELFNNYRVI